MTWITKFLSSVVLFSAIAQGWAAPVQIAQAVISQDVSPITLPAGTRVDLAVMAPVWAETAKPGDPMYTITNFPVASGNRMAIPAGVYVEGRIESIQRPTRRLSHAELQILFTKIIFANGYTIVLPEPTTSALASPEQTPPASTAANVTVQVSIWNDLLLDNGAQIEMTLAAPLMLDAKQVAAAIPLSRAPEPGKFRTATLCLPTPGTPGTPGTADTVIPGSPGTPSITIPGGPGMPDTTIPGTPSTPDTVIPGMAGDSGTPGTVCPAPPMVISSIPVGIKAPPNPSPAKAAGH